MSSSLLQTSLRLVCFTVLVFPLAQAVEGEADDRWGPWTSWSVCTQTCGSGLAYRVRHCHRSSGGEGKCSGHHKQHQLCNTQECPGGQEDYRTVECRKHNRNSYGGRRYEWEAFINPHARCELACKARHHRYYARFRKTVQDGTPCKHDSKAVCLAGKCLEVGCDGVLGSGAVVDQCGICGGDGSTCRVISGIFTRTRLRQYGYHHVTTIPAGACNVNITELARSRNYLALLTTSGENIVNGKQQLRPVGQYSGAGTTFDYRRRSGHWCPGACIFADGPLTESVTVQLLYYDRNPGIMYHFTVPQDTAKAVMKAANNSHPHNHHHHQNNNHHPQHPNPAAEELEDADDLSHHGIRQRNRPRAFSRRVNNKVSHGKLASLQDVSSTIGVSFDSTTTSLRQAPSSPRDHPSSGSGSGSRSHRPTSPVERSGFRLVPASQSSSSSSSSSSSFAREELSSPGREAPHRGSSSSGPRSGQSSPESGGAESPLQRPPSILPNVASAPRYVPPEGEEGAPIEYRHYYHVNSDHYRRHSQRNSGFAALNSGSRWRNRNELVGGGRSAGAEALSRPNLIPATHQARRRWRAGGDVISNDVNAVGDVPLAVPASGYFVWTISGFSSCSRPCGGGTQQTTVVCMKSDTRVVVMAENCDVNARPAPTTMECNTQPCDPQWTEEDWSACSVTCGHGVQTRRVECKQRISPTLHLSVSADRCPNPKPPVTQFCRQPPCFQWQLSNWTECSTHCGLGERSRRAWCVSGEGQEVEASQCSPERRPRTRVLCDMGSCAKGWYYSKWSKQCSPECGAKTYKTRQVHCAAEDGASLPGDKCPADQKPRTRKACGQPKPCGGKWFAGPWSQCNATCGEAWRSREVVCMKKHGRRLWGVVGKENCLRKERPLARDLCSDLPPCQPDWYMTHWSECSKPCGTGTKTREVKCLDASLKPSLTCNAKRRPQERRPCNKHSCDGDDDNDDDNSNSTRSHHHHPNSYDQRPRKVAAPQRYQESTSPNTTFQRYRQRNRTRQPMALKASPPAQINLQQDVRSALGDSSEDSSDHQRHHKRRHHSHHHHPSSSSSSNTTPQPTTEASILPDHSSRLEAPTTPMPSIAEQQTPPTPKAVDPQCTDKQNGRWCLFASQARLCGYSHYKKQCCQTCRKYNLHH